MKRLLLLIIYILSASSLHSQNQDCNTALSVCAAGVVVPDGLSPGVGALPETSGTLPGSGSCNFNNGVSTGQFWYTFTAGATGTFAFAAMATAPCDFDFAVYNVTGGCGPGMPTVGCDWSSDTGPTGLGCTGSFGCSPAITVTAGQTYAIMVNRWNNFGPIPIGFNLSFAGSSPGVVPTSGGTGPGCCPAASFTMTPTGTICKGTSVTFTNNSTGTGTYSWNFGDGTPAVPTATAISVTHVFNSTGTFNIVLTQTPSVAGCTPTTYTLPISVVGPTVTLTANPNVICLGQTVNFTQTCPTPGTVNVVMPPLTNNTNMNFGAPTYPGTINSTITTVAPIIPPVLSATSINQVCFTINHTFNDDIDVNLVSPTGCTINLTSDNCDSGDNYANTCFSPTASLNINVNDLIATSNITGVYLPEQPFSTLTGCNANGTWTLQVTDDVTGAAVGMLDSWSITFNNTYPNSITNYTWAQSSPNGGLVHANYPSVIGSPASATPTATGTYTYSLSATDGWGCTHIDTAVVTVIDVPSVSMTPTQACQGVATTVTYTGATTPGSTFTWNFGSGATPATATGLGPHNVTWSTNGPKTVSVTIVSSCGTNTGSQVITVAPTPSSNFNMATTACVNSNVSVIYLGTPVAGATYTWDFDGATIVSGSGSGPYQIKWTTANTYNVSLTVDGNGCTTTTTKTITINDAPTSSFTVNPNPVCPNEDVTITYTGTAPAGSTYNWNFGGGVVVTGSGAGPYTVHWSSAGPKNVTLSVTGGGCTSTPTIVPVTVNTPPSTPVVSNTGSYCVGETITLSTTAYGAGTTYHWSGPSSYSSTTVTNTVNIPSATTAMAGIYTLYVEDATGCISSNGTTNVVVSNPPTANAGSNVTLTCAAPCATIGAAPVAGNTYAWLPTTGLSNPSIANPSACPTVNTNYTLTVTSNGCSSTDIVNVVVSAPYPIANAGVDITVDCGTTCGNIGSAAIAGNTYSWSPTTNLSNALISNPSACPSVNTNYTVTVTNTASGCVSTDVVSVIVDHALPTVNAGTDKTTTCLATSASIGTTALAGYSYSWLPTAGLSPAPYTAAIITANPSTNTVYTLTATGPNGCTATDMVTVFVNETAPVSNAGSDVTTTCTVPSVTIGSAPVAGMSYSWSPTTGLSTPTTNSTVTANPLTTTTYTIVTTNITNGCTSADNVVVTVNENLPVANAGVDATVNCMTTCVPIGTTATAGFTYSWSPSTGLSASNVSNPNACPSLTTTYTVTVTNTSTGCQNTDAVTVTADNSAPIANAGSNMTTTCLATTATLGSPAVAGNTYSWTASMGAAPSAIAQPTVNPSANTTYTLTVTGANFCTASDVITVFVNETAPVSNAGSDVTTTCTVPSVTIGAASVAGMTYSWSPSTGLTPPTTNSTVVANPLTTTTYTVVTTNTTNGCTSSDNVIVTVNENLPVANAGSDATVNCLTTCVSIGTASAAGFSYSWSPSVGLSASNVSNPNACPVTTTTYTVTVTNTTTGCQNTDFVTITADNGAPIVNAGSDITTTCLATTATLGSPAIAGNTYSWAASIGTAPSAIAQPTVNPSVNTTYTLMVTGSNFCTASDIINVFVNETAPISNAGSDVTTTCTAPSATIGAAPVAGMSYSWSPTTGLSVPSTNSMVTADPLTTTTYTLVTTNTTNGCTSSDNVTVSVTENLPVANAGADVTVNCQTTCVAIGSSSTAGFSYTWSPATGLSASNISNPNACPLITTIYTLTITNTTTGCQNTDFVTVTADNVAPIADAGSDFTTTCISTTATLGSTAIVGNTYSWAASVGANPPSIAQPVVNPTVNTIYTLTVTGSNFCTSTDIVNVMMDEASPVSNAGADVTTTCVVPSATIGAAPVSGMTYSWSPSTGLLPPTTNASLIADPLVTTTYTVLTTNSTNGCTSTDNVIVTVNENLPIANAGADVTVNCASTCVSIGMTTTSGFSYSWSPSTGLSASNISNPNACPLVTTTYTLTVTDIVNGCQSTDIVTVSADNLAPVADAGADFTTNCYTPTIQIGSPAIPGNTYAWSPSLGLSAGGASSAQPIADPVANTTYTLIVTGSNFCTSTDIVTISVDKTPPVSNAGVDVTTTCSNPTATLGTTSTLGYTYSWSPITGITSASDLASIVADPSVNTTYTVITTGPNGCTASDNVTVTVTEVLPIADAGVDITVNCTNPSLNIGSATLSGMDYSWSPSFALSSTTISNPIASPTITTAYTVTVTNQITLCTNTDEVIVTVDQGAPIAEAGPDVTSTCASNDVAIGASATAGYTYSWTPSTFLSSDIVSSPTVLSPTAAQSYTLNVTGPNGCTATDIVNVGYDHTLPNVNAGTDKTLTCTTTNVSLDGSSSTPGVTYSWSNGDDFAISTTSLPNNYILSVTNPVNGCTASDDVTISQDIVAPLSDAGADITLTCVTTSGSIGAAANPNYSYTWTPSSDLTSSTISNPTADPIVSTTYTVTTTSNTNGCTSTDDVNVLLDLSFSTAAAGLDQNICVNTNTNLNANTPTVGSGTWTQLASNPSPVTFVDPTNSNTSVSGFTTAGDYHFVWTISYGVCTPFTDEVIITVTPEPTIPNAGIDQIVCASNTTLAGNNPAVGTGFWQQTSGPAGANIVSPTVYNSAVDGLLEGFTYTFTWTISNAPCSALSDDVNVTVQPFTTIADAGPDQFLCDVTTTVLAANTALVGTGSWSQVSGAAATISNSSDPNSSITGLTAGMYEFMWTISNAPCNSETDVVLITIYDSPTIANAGVDQTICNITSMNLAGNAASVGYGVWTQIAGPAVTITAPNTNNTSITGSVPGNDYSFQWEISNGNCPVSSDIINIRIDEAPSTALAGADQNLCEVTTTNLNATLPAIGIGSWTQISGNPTTIVNSFDPNTIIDGLSIGTFVYQWTVSTSGACPDAIDQVVIVVNPIPDATFTTIPTNLCAYDASIIIVPNQSGGTFSPTFTGFDGVTLDPATTSSGPHSITYDINILGCVNSSTQTFNINPAPTVSIDGLPTQICADLLPVDLNGSPAGGSFFGTGGSVTGTVASGFEFNPTLAGSYSVTYSYTDPLTLCSNNISQNVDVITSYDASFTGDASVYCESDTTSILTPITAGGTFFGDGISGNIFDPNLTAGSHTIGYTVGVGACTDTVLHTIMIYDNIIPTIDNLNASYCINNGPVSLAATPSGGTWSGTGMAGNIFYPEVASIGGPYALTYTYVNGGVCTNSTTADVTVTPVIIPQISANAIVCLDDTLIVNYTGSTSNISAFNWEFEEADYVAGTGSGPYYVVWNTEGYFDVNLSLVQADGCIVDTTFTIYVEEPSVQTISDMTVHYNESVILNTVIQPYTNNNPISVQWLPSSYLSCDTCEIPIANPLDDVTYIVTITDENGCTDQDTVTITVYIDDEIFVPTAFTPNDDGNNDVFLVEGNDLAKVNMKVFNRWGEKVFESDHQELGWDGTYKGVEVNPGVYQYIIDFEYVNGKKGIRKGNLTIIR